LTEIFISHSWEDDEVSRWLVLELKSLGVEVWADYTSVRPGDNLPKRVSDALEWCDTVLMVWSAAASVSRWVEMEWTAAVALGRVVIPCRVDSTPLPAILAPCLYVSLQDRPTAIRVLDETFRSRAPVAQMLTPPSTQFDYIGAIRGQTGDDPSEWRVFFQLGGVDDFAYFNDGYGPCGYKNWVRFGSFFSHRLFEHFYYKEMSRDGSNVLKTWDYVKDIRVKHLALDIFALKDTPYEDDLAEIVRIRESCRRARLEAQATNEEPKDGTP
jgi:hypothetical protein